jgi:N-acetylmuramic acid 6-phosphate etherase
VREVWDSPRITITNDLEIALACAEFENPELQNGNRVLILSGTGSCCLGAGKKGQRIKVGGWGHVLGDQGSGYAIALNYLRQTLRQWDRTGKWRKADGSLLRLLGVNDPNELTGWIVQTGKEDVAVAAKWVFDQASKKNPLACEVVSEAALDLAEDAIKCASRLTKGTGAFIFSGSILDQQKDFREKIETHISNQLDGSKFYLLKKPTVWGALHLASRKLTSPVESLLENTSQVQWQGVSSRKLSPTEERNPASMNLDRLGPQEAVDLFLAEEKNVAVALQKIRREISALANRAVEVLKKGGRIFYVGAGTSGRLGILDASECPPTFRSSPDQVQGIIAGGDRAIRHAVEGAEDDFAAGERAIAFREVNRRDLVIGIAASGRTPFVWGALKKARQNKAGTALICFNPHLEIEPSMSPDYVLAADLGPEILTGSTRLKSGTATKIILNIISTLAMVGIGKVASNLMIDLNPSNTKLRERAVRIVHQITGSTTSEAESALKQSGWVVKKALRTLGGKI